MEINTILLSNEELDKELLISKAAISLTIEMINYWHVGMSPEELYLFMRGITTNCDVLNRAATYWALAMRRSIKL